MKGAESNRLSTHDSLALETLVRVQEWLDVVLRVTIHLELLFAVGFCCLPQRDSLGPDLVLSNGPTSSTVFGFFWLSGCHSQVLGWSRGAPAAQPCAA